MDKTVSPLDTLTKTGELLNLHTFGNKYTQYGKYADSGAYMQCGYTDVVQTF